ncbi:MAG: tellurite resistance TerB family protein [Polyangiaceae bacterium]
MNDDSKLRTLMDFARTGTPGGEVPSRATASILALAAATYGAKPLADATVPTGFDPTAVALFEAIVEAAFLVAHADGVFDEAERRSFEKLVTQASGGTVASATVQWLVGELDRAFARDGMDKRIAMVAMRIRKPEHAREILRIASVVALATDDVGPEERSVLVRVAKAVGLDEAAVDEATAHVRAALAKA